MMYRSIVAQSLLSPCTPSVPPFLPDTHSAASCIARRTASRPVPSSSVTVFALMTAHYRPHRSLWGSSLRVLGKKVPHKGQLDAPPGAPLLGQYCLLWGESPNMTSPVHHQKPPCAYKHSSRQQHYNPPILDSTQFPQLGRTINNPHPTPSYPIHNPHSTYST